MTTIIASPTLCPGTSPEAWESEAMSTESSTEEEEDDTEVPGRSDEYMSQWTREVGLASPVTLDEEMVSVPLETSGSDDHTSHQDDTTLSELPLRRQLLPIKWRTTFRTTHLEEATIGGGTTLFCKMSCPLLRGASLDPCPILRLRCPNS